MEDTRGLPSAPPRDPEDAIIDAFYVIPGDGIVAEQRPCRNISFAENTSSSDDVDPIEIVGSPQRAVQAHLQGNFEHFQRTGQLSPGYSSQMEMIEVVGFLKILSRGWKLSHQEVSSQCCHPSPTSFTIEANHHFNGFSTSLTLPGYSSSDILFKNILRCEPAVNKENMLSLRMPIRQEQHSRQETDYSRSFVLMVSRNKGCFEILLTAESVEACYKLCSGLVLCKKHSSLLDDAFSPLSVLAHTVLAQERNKRRPINAHLFFGDAEGPVLKKGLRVEIEYYPLIAIKSEVNGRRVQLSAPVVDENSGRLVFGPGMYVRARVREIHNNRYTLAYEDGPYYQDSIGIGKKRYFDGQSTEFVDVDRAFLSVELTGTHAFKFPYFVIIISMVQLFMFFWYCWSNKVYPMMHSPIGGDPWLWFKLVGSSNSDYSIDTTFPECADLRVETWRFFSYQLVHMGYLHLGGNIFMQLFLGIPLEMVHGTFRVALLYQTGVLMGAVTSGFSSIYSNVVGASGGVFCLLGAHIANLVLNWSELKRSFCNHWAILFMILVLLGAHIYSMKNPEGSASVSYATHYGGFATGVLAGILHLRNPVKHRFTRSIIFPLACCCQILFVIGGIGWVFTQWPPRFLIHLEWPNAHANPPCCWQLLVCTSINPSDYSNFNCDAKFNEEGNAISVVTGKDGLALAGCAAMSAYASLASWH